LLSTCNKKDPSENPNEISRLEIGGDFSIMKKMEDSGGIYGINGAKKEGFQIFKDNGYSWARLRIFHTPNMEGPVCNDLNYTIALAQKAKQLGFKIFLNFHYSDTWADPGKQYTPKAWEDLTFELLTDSVYVYTKNVINAMDEAGVLPELVQVGNEINNGMIWPQGKLWIDGNAQWDKLTTLIKAGIRGVKEADNGDEIPVMIHAATGGNLEESKRFYENIIQRGAEFDILGLSYYPWWHGTFEQLEANLQFLSNNFEQEISLVETAYYANGWYPEPEKWVLDVQPYTPTEQGQYDFMVHLKKVLEKYPKVTSLYYWKPDGLKVPESGVNFIGRSLFDEEGNALKGISAWK
ncbi:MAG: glycosyl hydrolase 53 family protein, partial [Draconibacterium sp.]|nr:glycosyl hydrolase 53 family protein [Draconibacterium sp.]